MFTGIFGGLSLRTLNGCKSTHFLNFQGRKKVFTIIRINKNEKEQLLKQFPKMHNVRTMKQDSKRHHYFMTEEPEYVEALKIMRNGKVGE